MMMNKTISSLFLIFLLFALLACMDDVQQDVTMETMPIPEGVKIGSVALGPKYTNLFYYNLDENKVEKSGTIYDYDLAFDCRDDGAFVLLNSARYMHAGFADQQPFEDVTGIQGINFRYDASSGNPDSTAIGQRWFEINAGDTVFHNQVIVIDLGMDENGISLGYKKIILTELRNGIYALRHADLDGSNDFYSNIAKDDRFNYIGFSFDDAGKTIEFEPESDKWHLFFGQYTTLLWPDNEPLPYLVRGVKNNPEKVQSLYFENNITFAEIDHNTAIGAIFSSNVDAIGHEWKYYDLEEGFYAVKSDQNYLIRDAGENYFKLRFLSYFNENGESGYPRFEFQKLLPASN